MKLLEGQPAKDFATEDILGNPIALRDYRGNRLMLSFFRYASCPLCNLRIHHLIEQYPALNAKGLRIIAVFQSPPESIRHYAGRQDPPFSIIADPERILFRQYGVESSWVGFIKGSLRLPSLAAAAARGFLPGKMEGQKAMIPADFLIGPDLKVQIAYYGGDIGDHLPIQRIYAWLDNARERAPKKVPQL